MTDRITSYWKLHKLPILLLVASVIGYFVIGYKLVRTDLIEFFGLYAALFFFCFKLIQFEKWNFRFLLFAGIAFRLVFLLAIPNLSQDFYRFIWDGQLVLKGINPYLYLPDELIAQNEQIISNARILQQGMGELSARHFSNYPPLNQFLFSIGAFFGNNSILGSAIALRLIIISADLGIIYFGRKLLKQLNRSPHMIFWYFLNPLVIIELSGNLHFEGVMLFFFIWSIYLLSVHKWLWAAVIYAFSISVKLIPLMFLPFFLKHLGLKKSLFFYALVGLVSLALLFPFYTPEFIDNYSETVGLWFSNFEFNASIYNIVKKIGIQFDAKPWELIKSYGKITPLITIAVVLLLTFLRKNQKIQVLLGSMLVVLTTYYFLTTTVHPWYIIFLVLLAIYTDLRFPLFWSATVVLSYVAYSNADYTENLFLLFVEYFIVYGFIVYEFLRLKGTKVIIRKN